MADVVDIENCKNDDSCNNDGDDDDNYNDGDDDDELRKYRYVEPNKGCT